MAKSFTVKCPICFRWLTGKFTPHQSGQMARWYWYCKHCKCSITKSVRKGDV